MESRPIHSIETEADNDAAIERIAELMEAKPGIAEVDELDSLATLVDAYESEHYKFDEPDSTAAADFRMEQGISR